MSEAQKNYRWYILALVVLTDMLIMAIPTMGLSVLAKEISQELNLNLVQVGIVWGVGSLPAIFIALAGGTVSDLIGPKRVLVFATLAGGLLSAARGLAVDFLSLTVVVLLHGALVPLIVTNGLKLTSQWFPSGQLAIANGLVSAGIALGFLIGAAFSATVFSPLLGGWRNVLIVYGLLGTLLTLPWVLSRPAPTSAAGRAAAPRSLVEAMRQVVSIKNIWLLAFALFGFNGAVQGLLGYLPLYLRDLGWTAVSADGAVSAFHTVSLLCVMPIALISTRLGLRKSILLFGVLMVALGTGILSIARGTWVWAAVILAGFVRDGFMSMFFTTVVETGGVGPAYAATAIGLTMAVSYISNLIAPPLGNSMAAIDPGAPFAFWCGLSIFGITCLLFIRSRVGEAVPGGQRADLGE